MQTNLQVVENNIMECGDIFNKIAMDNPEIDFKKEANFAIQIMKSSSYLADVAFKNPDSLRFAVINIASIGLSLNPAIKQAYLVPRGGKIVLDVSYLGLYKIACESGAIKWIQTELVYETDNFQITGVGEKPNHSYSPMSKDRGAVTGCYVVAKTEDGEYLTTFMRTDEIHAIRDRTEAWKSFQSGRAKSCPWHTDEGEMMKKTVIKRAFKTWPSNDKRIAETVNYLDRSGEGIDFKKEAELPKCSENQIEIITFHLDSLERDEKAFIGFFNKKEGIDVESIENLNVAQAESAIGTLKQMLDKKNALTVESEQESGE